MASLPTILLILAALSTGAAVIAALIAFRSQQEARSAIFPIVREEESVKARRALLSIFVWVAITALFFGGWLATLRLTASDDSASVAPATPSDQPAEATAAAVATETPIFALESSPADDNVETAVRQPTPEILATDTPVPPGAPTSTATSSPEPTQPPTDTSTPPPSATFTATPLPPTATPTETPLPPTATPTATSTPVPPTAIPTSTVAALRIPTSAPRTPAPPGVKVGPIQFATEMTEDFHAVDPNDSFPNGVKTIYAVFPFSGMSKGLDFTVVWYQNGVELARDEGEWQWGERARSFVFLVPRGKGLYKLELYINDTVVATSIFEVR